MSSLNVLKVKLVRTNLCKKGFTTHDTDHEMFVFCINGVNSQIRTKISHGEAEIGKPLIAKMAKQLHLSISEFEDFALCKMSENEYVEILKQKNIVE